MSLCGNLVSIIANVLQIWELSSQNFLKAVHHVGTLLPWKFVYIERDQNKWNVSMDDIMTTEDPQVETQLRALTATQEEFKKSKAAQAPEQAQTAKAE